MKFGKFVFKPSPVLTVLIIILIPVFIRLGIWQLDRGAQRRALQDAIEQRMDDEPFQLNRYRDDMENIRFAPVKVRGRFDKQHEFLLDNAINLGEAGYYVITPLLIEGTELRVLINRGWVPMGTDRNILPQIDTPAEIIEITGHVDTFQKRGFTLGKMEIEKGSWPKRWTYMDAELFVNNAGYKILPFMVLTDKNSPAGFESNWDFKFFHSKALINLGYAIQWFAFAFIALILYVVFSTRKSLAAHGKS